MKSWTIIVILVAVIATICLVQLYVEQQYQAAATSATVVSSTLAPSTQDLLMAQNMCNDVSGLYYVCNADGDNMTVEIFAIRNMTPADVNAFCENLLNNIIIPDNLSFDGTWKIELMIASSTSPLKTCIYNGKAAKDAISKLKQARTKIDATNAAAEAKKEAKESAEIDARLQKQLDEESKRAFPNGPPG